MFRDWDGVVRRIRSSGQTKSAADQAIQLVLRDRRYAGRDVITRETKFPEVANKWFSELNDLSPSTRQRYRERLDRFIIPAFKEVRMREITVGLIDRHLNAVKQTHGAASAKVTKTILSGVFGLATRHDALPTNPCRDVARISVKPKRVARPISAEDFRVLREWFAADLQARCATFPISSRFLQRPVSGSAKRARCAGRTSISSTARLRFAGPCSGSWGRGSGSARPSRGLAGGRWNFRPGVSPSLCAGRSRGHSWSFPRRGGVISSVTLRTPLTTSSRRSSPWGSRTSPPTPSDAWLPR